LFQVLVLICAQSISPADCQPYTATDVIVGPQANSVMECGLYGQSLVASSAHLGRSPGEYVKIRCARPREVVRDHTQRRG